MIEVVQRKRTRGWRKPEGAVYVGRGSRWGNPFHSGDKVNDAKKFADMFGEECWNENGRFIAIREIMLELLWQLKGKSLMCWCGSWAPGEPEIACHAVVLAKLANDLD